MLIYSIINRITNFLAKTLLFENVRPVHRRPTLIEKYDLKELYVNNSKPLVVFITEDAPGLNHLLSL